MQNRQSIKCPQCGSDNVELIQEGMSRGRYGKPTSATVAYTCACGTGFTETFRTPGASPPTSHEPTVRRLVA